MKAKTKAKGARKAAPATDRHIGVRVTPELAALLEERRSLLERGMVGANVSASDVVRGCLIRELGGFMICLSPLALRAAREGAEREGMGVDDFVTGLVLEAIPEAE